MSHVGVTLHYRSHYIGYPESVIIGSQCLSHDAHTVKILGFRQKKLYKGFYAKNVVPYTYEDDI